jgi:hypothetical protein
VAGGRGVDAMRRTVGSAVLGLSACGYPLTQLVVRRWGLRGMAVAEAVCAGLTVRDAAMVAASVPGKLRPVPAALLRLELAAGMVASLAGLGALLLGARSPGQGSATRAGAVDAVRRTSVAALFAVHTIRFGIYLSPDQGRRAVPPSTASVHAPGRARQPR